MNVVILYMKDKLMPELKEKYSIIVGQYKYGTDRVQIAIRVGMVGYSVYRGILWDIGINFLEYEKRLTAAKLDYILAGNSFSYNFVDRDTAKKAIDILYEVLFEARYTREGTAVDEYSRSIQE